MSSFKKICLHFLYSPTLFTPDSYFHDRAGKTSLPLIFAFDCVGVYLDLMSKHRAESGHRRYERIWMVGEQPHLS